MKASVPSVPLVKAPVAATTIPSGWTGSLTWPMSAHIQEPFTGAWQRNMDYRPASLLSFHALYACVTLIASDISKLRIRLVQLVDGIWSEIDVPAFTPVLRKPNHYQNRIKFYEHWIISKLIHGNTYVLKERDNRNVVVRLYILDPCRTKPMVAPDGSVFYELSSDNLSGLEGDHIMVPASEIIHDTMVPLYHPLCGVSPIIACGLAAMQGLSIQQNSNKFFANGSMLGGVLSAPGEISDATAERLKKYFEQNYLGPSNTGKVAVLGDGLKFEAMTVKAADAQLIEQLKWTAETVCSCFYVPPYMIGVGTMPNYNNIEALNQQYYSQCLQALIESIELCLDEGLGIGVPVEGRIYGTEFDIDDLLRMDTKTKVESWGNLVKAGIASPDEARNRFSMKPVQGGDTPYLQQQNYSLAALSKRDSKDDPFATATAATATAPAPKDEVVDDEEIDDAEPEQRSWPLDEWVKQIDSRRKYYAISDDPA